MANLKERIESNVGHCAASHELRRAIEAAIAGHAPEWLNDDGETIASVELIDDESEHEYNAENTMCATVKLVSGSETVHVGYYSDGAEHYLDTLVEEISVTEWASMWDRDSILVDYLTRKGTIAAEAE